MLTPCPTSSFFCDPPSHQTNRPQTANCCSREILTNVDLKRSDLQRWSCWEAKHMSETMLNEQQKSYLKINKSSSVQSQWSPARKFGSYREVPLCQRAWPNKTTALQKYFFTAHFITIKMCESEHQRHYQFIGRRSGYYHIAITHFLTSEAMTASQTLTIYFFV